MDERSVIPYLTVVDADAAITFYRAAFEARETGPRLTNPNGKVVHTEVLIGNATVMLAEHMPEFGTAEPRSLGGTPVRLALTVANADATVERALQAGARSLLPVEDQFYGQRAGRVEDPFGHVWIVSHPIETLAAEEMQQRLAALFGEKTRMTVRNRATHVSRPRALPS